MIVACSLSKQKLGRANGWWTNDRGFWYGGGLEATNTVWDTYLRNIEWMLEKRYGMHGEESDPQWKFYDDGKFTIWRQVLASLLEIGWIDRRYLFSPRRDRVLKSFCSPCLSIKWTNRLGGETVDFLSTTDGHILSKWPWCESRSTGQFGRIA